MQRRSAHSLNVASNNSSEGIGQWMPEGWLWTTMVGRHRSTKASKPSTK